MPRGDRTGPMGMGAMTGRAGGYRTGFRMPGCANFLSGRGFGMAVGRGRGAWSRGFGGAGRGWRHRFHATGQLGWMRFGGYTAYPGFLAAHGKPDPELEKQALRNEADALKSELEAIQKRLSDIETAPQGE